MTTATPPSRDRVAERARARAHAAEIVDNGIRVRSFHVPTGSLLRTAERRRIHAPKPKKTPRAPERSAAQVLGIVVLALEVMALLALLVLPVFQVRSVSISGNALLTREAVLDAAGVPSASLFTVNGAAVRTRLLQLPWIRSATVTTTLPNAVRIAIVEWSPVLRVHRDGHDTLVADSGATIDASAGRPDVVARIPVMVDERVASTDAPSAALVQILDATSGSFPTAFGTSVAAYEWRSDGVLVIWARAGWSAVLGHEETSDAVAAIPGQLSALASLKGKLDFVHPAFGYVDLENATAPAVGGTPGLPAAVTAALAAQPQSQAPAVPAPPAPAHSAVPAPAQAGPVTMTTPAPTQAPTPAPAAAAPTATPYTFYVNPPPSH